MQRPTRFMTCFATAVLAVALDAPMPASADDEVAATDEAGEANPPEEVVQRKARRAIPAIRLQAADGFEFDPQAVQQTLATQSAQMTHTLKLHLDALDRICHLTDEQRKLLRIAAKGAVDRAIEQYRQQLAPRQDAEDADGDGEPDLVEIEPEFDRADVNPDVPPAAEAPQPVPAVVVDQRRMRMNVFLHGNGRVAFASRGNHDAILNEPIWVNTIDQVLTEPQRRAVQQAKRARGEYAAQAIIRGHVASLDRSLQLSAEQRDQLGTLITESMRPLIAQAIRTDRIAKLPQTMSLMNITQRLSNGKLARQKLSGLLSEAQLEEWERIGEGGFAQFGGFEPVPQGFAAPQIEVFQQAIEQ